MEDMALTLKRAVENGDDISAEKAKEMLEKSELIEKLLTDPKLSTRTFVGVRALEWRLIELAEIPYSYTLEKVQKWIDLLVSMTSISEGFSLTGEKDGVLACHNALTTTLLIKMNYSDRNKIDAGIKWILDYQSVERGIECKWQGKDLYTRFGGCMMNVPCFYGVIKSMIALTEYKKRYGSFKELDDKLGQGLEYILKHRLFKKLSSDLPIDSSMIKCFYPYSYKSNIIEILSLMKANGRMEDERCKEAISVLKQSRHKDGFWQAEVSYMKTSWVDFDKLNKPGPWITYIISNLLGE